MKIMGFGHRVYREYDPRSRVIEPWVERLADTPERQRLYDIARRIVDVMWREKRLFPNVDFYSALLYHFLGIPAVVVYAAVRALADQRLVGPHHGAARRQSLDSPRRRVRWPGTAGLRAARKIAAPPRDDVPMASPSVHRPAAGRRARANCRVRLRRRRLREEAYATARLSLMDSLGLRFWRSVFRSVRSSWAPSFPGQFSRAEPRPRHRVRTRSGPGGLLPGHHDPLAGLQRHLAGGRMGASLGQSGGDPGHCRLAQPRGPAGRPAAAASAGCLDRHDPGLRNSRRAGAGKRLQSGRSGSCPAGPRGIHRGRLADARR